ncbi:hypothetical protein P154DRAFT_605356 [Amniculicola lignicola CBS 123094]|uniref:Uncharacterized protein n=1 Tax=Amniculicola lignicola CBS 123094 TaxID=1392246 RepID=A0A6A5WA33_9PLEO|nr:hypothetical protein P154DRAFT_605356 [Amniculicola lignicola CBS 123094]
MSPFIPTQRPFLSFFNRYLPMGACLSKSKSLFTQAFNKAYPDRHLPPRDKNKGKERERECRSKCTEPLNPNPGIFQENIERRENARPQDPPSSESPSSSQQPRLGPSVSPPREGAISRQERHTDEIEDPDAISVIPRSSTSSKTQIQLSGKVIQDLGGAQIGGGYGGVPVCSPDKRAARSRGVREVFWDGGKKERGDVEGMGSGRGV